MKKFRIALGCFLVFTLALVQLSTAQNGQAADNTYGAAFTPDEVIPATELPAKMRGQERLDAQIEGVVKSVCQAKGCWMRVDVGDGQEMLVKFKDYGFFVPTNSAGKRVVMNGTAFTETTSVEELRHYAKDAGKSAKEIAKIKKPERSLQFEADGVVLAE
jgi:hypothetical protein